MKPIEVLITEVFRTSFFDQKAAKDMDEDLPWTYAVFTYIGLGIFLMILSIGLSIFFTYLQTQQFPVQNVVSLLYMVMGIILISLMPFLATGVYHGLLRLFGVSSTYLRTLKIGTAIGIPVLLLSSLIHGLMNLFFMNVALVVMFFLHFLLWIWFFAAIVYATAEIYKCEVWKSSVALILSLVVITIVLIVILILRMGTFYYLLFL